MSHDPGSTSVRLVLLVLSDAARRTAYAEALERWGLRVAQAETAQHGLRAAWELEPDVIAVDLAGLGVEGSRFLRGLWGVPATSRIPLVRFCESASATAIEAPDDATVVLTPGCLPEQLFAAIGSLVEVEATDASAPKPARSRRVRMPRVEPPFPRRKPDRRRPRAPESS
jgi:CheY-like chemotaxis protein